MIVKNEGRILADCLRDAARFADEIVITDTGSADDTVNIAREFTDKVYDFAWNDDFAAARNASFEKATGDYCMWLDADDRIDDDNCLKIKRWKEAPAGKLILAGYDRPENGGIFIYPRLIRRDSGFIWKGIIHEHLVYDGNRADLTPDDIVTADFVIRHCKSGAENYARNIRIMEHLSEEELLDSFWLCAQCYLDCVLAHEDERAAYYLKLAADSRTPFADRLKDYALINSVLKHRKQYDAMLRWNAMYMESKKHQPVLSF